MERIEAHQTLGLLFSFGWEVGLGLFVLDIDAAYLKGWACEWDEEWVVEAIDILTMAIWGV